jgi:hypothetical protein
MAQELTTLRAAAEKKYRERRICTCIIYTPKGYKAVDADSSYARTNRDKLFCFVGDSGTLYTQQAQEAYRAFCRALEAHTGG